MYTMHCCIYQYVHFNVLSQCSVKPYNMDIELIIFPPEGPTGPTGPGGPTMMRGAEVDLGCRRSSEEEEKC